MDVRNTGVATGGNVINTRTFGHDEANTSRRTLSVVLNVSVCWDILGRLIAGHRRHYNAVVQFQTADIYRTQKGVIRTHY